MTYKHRDIVIAYMDGKQIQYKSKNMKEWASLPLFNPVQYLDCLFYADQEYRIKPETRKYRVGVLKNQYTVTVDSEEQEFSLKENPSFTRWLTDWVEYEV